MYLDILKSDKISSLATGADRPRASYTECLESIISLREEELRADSELMAVEFRNYHLGLEAEDPSFWSKIQTVVRKLMELLKTVASKITAYIQTVPGRIHNFVMRVSNWAAKIGLESKLKNLVQTQDRRKADPEKSKEFMAMEFGPMNFDEIILGVNTTEKVEQAQADKTPGTMKKKLIEVCTGITSALLGKFWPRFNKSAKEVLAARREIARTAGADAASQSGTATVEKANSMANAKVFTLKEFAEEDKNFREMLDLIDNANDAINSTKKGLQVPTLDGIWNMLKTVTNGNIEKQSSAVISAIDRAKRQVDAVGRAFSAGFNAAYAAKDSEKVYAIREFLTQCRILYTTYIKMIVRVDSAAQHCTSNVIKYVKAAMACYQNTQGDQNAEKVGTPETTEQKNNAANNNQGQPAQQQTSDNVQDFSHIFDF